MTDFDIVVVGDCNADLLISGGDVTPVFGQQERLVDEANLTIGGSGGIFAAGAARLGLRVAMAGVLGDDIFGRFMRESLAARGVDLSAVRTHERLPTGLSVHLLRQDDRAIITSPGTIPALRPDDVDLDLLRSARHVHVSAYFLQAGLWAGLPALLREARAAGATVSLDPNWDPSGTWDHGLTAATGLLDVLLPNDAEAIELARARSAAGSRAAGSEGISEAAKGTGNLGEPNPVPIPAEPLPETLDYVTVYDNHNMGGFAGGEPVGKADNFRCAYAKKQGKPRDISSRS